MDTEEQKDIFNMLHDGSFICFRQVNNDIHFEVDIEYLAQMLHPDYHLFKGILKNCQLLALTLWDREEVIEDRDQINALLDDLEIGSASLALEGIRVICLGHPGFGLGGELHVVCDDIHLFDEADQTMSVGDLRMIWRSYWQNFGKR